MTVPVPEPDAMSLHDAVPRPRAIAVASAFEARLHPTLATVAAAQFVYNRTHHTKCSAKMLKFLFIPLFIAQ